MIRKNMEIDGVKIDYLGHDGFLITIGSNGNSKKIIIDPFNVNANINDKADLILITHSHYDHCSIKDIERFAKDKTVIVIPPDAQSKITKIENIQMEIVEPGIEFDFGNIRIETIPAYNIDKEFHNKKDGWVGYIIKTGKFIIYHAGDTDKIPEMEKLTGYGKEGNKFIALLPVSGKYVMTADEAADAAAIIHPDIAVPMHYGSGIAGTREDAEGFVKLCKEKGINAEIIEKT